jgi:hypothetical protein
MDTIQYSLVYGNSSPKCMMILFFIGVYTIIILMTTLAISGMVYYGRQYYHLEYLKRVSIKTTCVVKKYNFTERMCESYKCWSCTCYDEQFKVTYRITNGAQMTNTIHTKNIKMQTHTAVREWTLLLT